MTEQGKVWEAVSDLASLWQKSGIVADFRRDLPRNSTPPTVVAQQLQEWQAKYQFVTGSPTQIASRARHIRTLSGDKLPDRPFLDLATVIEAAVRLTVAWLRSRLPGYPLIPALQLTPGSATLETQYISQRLGWNPRELSDQLQFDPAPPRIADVLQVASLKMRLDNAAIALSRSLADTLQWRHFQDSHKALLRSDRELLIDARKTVRLRLSDSAVDEYELHNVWRRSVYREEVMQEEISRLEGPARTYTDAFGEVDRLIDETVAHVFGQQVAYGPPEPLSGVVDLTIEGAGSSWVSFTVPDAWFDCGTVYYIDDPLIADVVLVHGVNTHGSQLGMESRVSAEILRGAVALTR